MQKQKVKKLVTLGVGCFIVMITAIIYSVLYNESRLVVETDMSTYTYSVKDTPMIIAGMLLTAYIIYLVVFIIKNVKLQKDVNHTRKISPYLGMFGFFGFLGVIGFWTYSKWNLIFPFIFFTFFGFFGFFFEGKLSDTLKDELFEANEKKAEIKAYKTGFSLLFIVIWLVGMGMLSKNIEWCAIFMLVSISLIYALVLFLCKYYLYRLEKED